MALNLPPWSVFDDELRLLVWRPRGVVDEAFLENTVEWLEAVEQEATEPFNRYFDLSQMDAVDLRWEFLFENGLRRRATRAKEPPVKAAMYVTSKATRRVAQTHALLTENSPLQVRVFQEELAAADWLGVRVEDLAAN